MVIKMKKGIKALLIIFHNKKKVYLITFFQRKYKL